MDLRTPELNIEFAGRRWTLRCNMNVLCEIQERAGGNIMDVLMQPSTLSTCRSFLTAMLNDAADREGLHETFTERQVGRLLPGDPQTIKWMIDEIWGLVKRSMLYTPNGAAEEEKTEKN